MKRGKKKLHLPRRGKKRSQIIHLRKRLSERFSITLTQQELESITSIIRNGGSSSVRKVSRRITKHIIPFKDEQMVVIYDKVRGIPVTCYKPKGK